MHTIGFDDAGIGVMVASYCAVVLLAETPTGILADRWSRKGVLILASIMLALSSLICGISTEPSLYVIGILIWGIFYALYSGTYDSIVYDTVLEETGKSNESERHLGHVRMIDSLALVTGSLVGGIISNAIGMEWAFFWTIPIALAAIFALYMFKEPILHKAEPLGNMKEQIRDTFRSAFGKRSLLRIVVVLLLINLGTDTLYEFSQLWFIEASTSQNLFGPIYAVVLSTSGIGGYLAGRTAKCRRKASVIAFVALFVNALVLTLPVNTWVILCAQTFVGTSIIVLSVLLTTDLHNNLPSRVRAGAASAVSSVMRVLFIPTSLLFGTISASYGTHSAGWILVVIVVIAAYLEFLPSHDSRISY